MDSEENNVDANVTQNATSVPPFFENLYFTINGSTTNNTIMKKNNLNKT